MYHVAATALLIGILSLIRTPGSAADEARALTDLLEQTLPDVRMIEEPRLKSQLLRQYAVLGVQLDSEFDFIAIRDEWLLTRPQIHNDNHFSYQAAALFAAAGDESRLDDLVAGINGPRIQLFCWLYASHFAAMAGHHALAGSLYDKAEATYVNLPPRKGMRYHLLRAALASGRLQKAHWLALELHGMEPAAQVLIEVAVAAFEAGDEALGLQLEAQARAGYATLAARLEEDAKAKQFTLFSRSWGTHFSVSLVRYALARGDLDGARAMVSEMAAAAGQPGQARSGSTWEARNEAIATTHLAAHLAASDLDEARRLFAHAISVHCQEKYLMFWTPHCGPPSDPMESMRLWAFHDSSEQPLEFIERLPDSHHKTILRLAYIQGAIQRTREEPEIRKTTFDWITKALSFSAIVDDRIIACGLSVNSAFSYVRLYFLVCKVAMLDSVSVSLKDDPNADADPASK